jgi:cell division protein FtsQ
MKWGRPKNRRVSARAQSGQRGAGLGGFALPWRRMLGWTGLAAGIAGAVLGGLWLLDAPIRTVFIAGRFERVAPLDVERAVRQCLHGAGLVGVDLDAVRAAVRTLPWVDGVQVQRSWPRGLAVTIGEQVAAARWSGGGLLNIRGELFTADGPHTPAELPALAGPDGSQGLVVQRYLAMRGRLAEAGMRLTALRLDARGAWEFDLDNGVTVRLGRRQIDGRFDTFMGTAAKIVAQRAADIAYVDMRYASGFVIGWRGAAGHEGSRTSGEARNV